MSNNVEPTLDTTFQMNDRSYKLGDIEVHLVGKSSGKNQISKPYTDVEIRAIAKALGIKEEYNDKATLILKVREQLIELGVNEFQLQYYINGKLLELYINRDMPLILSLPFDWNTPVILKGQSISLKNINLDLVTDVNTFYPNKNSESYTFPELLNIARALRIRLRGDLYMNDLSKIVKEKFQKLKSVSPSRRSQQ